MQVGSRSNEQAMRPRGAASSEPVSSGSAPREVVCLLVAQAPECPVYPCSLGQQSEKFSQK